MGQELDKAGGARGAWSRCAWCGVKLDRHAHLKEDDYGGACETCSAALRARARGAAPVPGC